jgi:hypothetical protein
MPTRSTFSMTSSKSFSLKSNKIVLGSNILAVSTNFYHSKDFQMSKPSDRFGGSNRPIANETPGPAGGKVPTTTSPLPRPTSTPDRVLGVIITNSK